MTAKTDSSTFSISSTSGRVECPARISYDQDKQLKEALEDAGSSYDITFFKKNY